MDQTERAVAKMRIRGAPTSDPDVTPLVPDFAFGEILLPALRAVVTSLGEGRLTFDKLAPALDLVEAHLGTLEARRAGPAFVVVSSDPWSTEPHKRQHEVAIPITGEAKGSEDGRVSPRRIDDGSYVVGRVRCTAAQLEHVWTWLFGRFLPERNHRLARPAIRIAMHTDPRTTADAEMEYEIFVPVVPIIPAERRLAQTV